MHFLCQIQLQWGSEQQTSIQIWTDHGHVFFSVLNGPVFEKPVLCILTSFWMLSIPKSWLKCSTQKLVEILFWGHFQPLC